MISLTTEYALRAAVVLAGTGGGRLTTPQIAEGAGVPSGYLSKVLQSLGRAGIVDSARGLGGGFSLSQDPKKVTVLDVVNAVGPLSRIHVCPLGRKEHNPRLCPLHQHLDDAVAEVERVFGETTLAELREKPRRRKRTCDFPLSAIMCAEAASDKDRR